MITINQKELRTKSREVKGFMRLWANRIIKYLEKELPKGALGLSAIQVGIRRRIAIVRFSTGESINLINPVITDSEELREFSGEQCLSIPNLTITTKRYNRIYLTNYDRKYIFEGRQAQVIQHEIDHMDGILMTDKQVKRDKSYSTKRPNYYRYHIRRKITGR